MCLHEYMKAHCWAAWIDCCGGFTIVSWISLKRRPKIQIQVIRRHSTTRTDKTMTPRAGYTILVCIREWNEVWESEIVKSIVVTSFWRRVLSVCNLLSIARRLTLYCVIVLVHDEAQWTRAYRLLYWIRNSGPCIPCRESARCEMQQMSHW